MKDGVPNTRAERLLARRAAFLHTALGMPRPLRIADVGANPIHTPPYHDLLQLGGCEVWGFEPEPEAFAALEASAGPNTHYLQRAVGPKGPATFYGNKMSGIGSLFRVSETAVNYLAKRRWHRHQHAGIPLDLVALDDLPDDELPKPDLVKIDIQGGELGVFESGRAKLSQATCIITEVRYYRIYENEPFFHQVDKELHDQGFVLHRMLMPKTTTVANSQRGRMKKKAFYSQLMDGDAIYIRDPATIADWSDDQVMQLAVAAATIFDSFDLTVHCLDALVARGVVAEDAPAGFVDQLPPWMFAEA